jgi:V-type H+-transporting ATPase subunit d
MQLSSTDYGNFLANEPLPLSTSTIADKATEKLVAEFHYLRTNANEPLATFMDYITYAYMIDNVILLTLGTLHERDTHELLDRCHPLGVFDTMPALCVATNIEELYHSVLVETPLGEFIAYPKQSRANDSAILPRLPFRSGLGRSQYRNHSKRALQSLPRRFLRILSNPLFSNFRNNVENLGIRSRSSNTQHHHQFIRYRIIKRSKSTFIPNYR